MKSIHLLIMSSLLAGIIFTSCHKAVNTVAIAVEAGAFQYIQLPTDSAMLTGTVTTGENIATVYSWTQLSGPNTTIISNGSSLAAKVHNLIVGTYIFQFEATNASGTTIGIDTAGIVVTPPGTTVLTLQPDSAQAKEALAYSYLPTSPSDIPAFRVWAWTVSSVPVYSRGYLQFDLSSIPASSTILNARLSLYSLDTADFLTLAGGTQTPQFSDSGKAIGLSTIGFPQVNGNALSIKRVTQNWNMNTLDWNNMPTSTDTNEAIIPQVANGFSNATDIDVTAMVQDMQTNGNNGFVIGLIDELYYNQRFFETPTCTDSTLRPKLVIVYQ